MLDRYEILDVETEKFKEIINLSEILNFSNDEEISFYLYGAHLNYLNISSLFNTSI